MSEGSTLDKVNGVVDDIRAAFDGRLVGPRDPDYDQARAVWNGMIDRRPGLIAYCESVSDVIAALTAARDAAVPLAVRGGGHNAAGSAVCDDGLVIDLSPMRAVEVDEATGRVRVQGGATIGDLDRATQQLGLAVPQGVVSETGIAGLTLGGGVGWLRRRHGLSCDNLVSAEVVTAEGRLVIASEDENADLLWGLKGGGGNFGVVTTFELQAHPVGPDVYAAVVFHPQEHVAEALRFYREWEVGCPDEISSVCILGHVAQMDEIPPDRHNQPMVAFLAVHAGDPADGEAALRTLQEHGTPLVDFSGTMPYVEMQQFFDEDYPSGELRYYWKSLLLDDVPDEALDQLAELNVRCPSPLSTIDLWELGGAVSRVEADATAFGDRSARYLLGIEANWADAGDDEANLAWAREVHRVMSPYSRGGEYFNFPGLFEDADRTVPTTFGDNYRRLVDLKRQWDPDNLFRLNQNVAPSA